MQYEILKNRSFINISGADSSKFLQGITTNKILPFSTDIVRPPKMIYTLMLSPQGRYICDFFIIPLEEENYLLDIETVAKDRLLSKLKIYKMRSKINIHDVSDKYLCIYSTKQICSMSFQDPRYQYLKYRSITDIDQISQYLHEIPNLYNQDKYEFTIPDGDIDMISDKSLPPEYGIEFLNGISYTKGCYVGQEVMSRTKYQGVVRKKLYSVNSDIDIQHLAYGTEIKYLDKKIGILCSAYRNKGIALIREVEEMNFSKAHLDGVEVLINPAVWYQ